MFSKQAPPLFIGRPSHFQLNKKVSQENCQLCIWNENILKQSWFIWITGLFNLSFFTKSINLVQLTTAIAATHPKHAQWDKKKSLSYSSQTFTDTHMQGWCEGSNSLWDRVERILWIQQQPWVRHCPDGVLRFPVGGAITCHNKLLEEDLLRTVRSRCPVVQSRSSCMSFVQYIIVKVDVFVLIVSRWCGLKA